MNVDAIPVNVMDALAKRKGSDEAAINFALNATPRQVFTEWCVWLGLFGIGSELYETALELSEG
jgi:hypothetical protein